MANSFTVLTKVVPSGNVYIYEYVPDTTSFPAGLTEPLELSVTARGVRKAKALDFWRHEVAQIEVTPGTFAYPVSIPGMRMTPDMKSKDGRTILIVAELRKLDGTLVGSRAADQLEVVLPTSP